MVHALNLPVEADDAWEAWPAPPFPEPAAEHQQEALSVQMSGVSNQPSSESIENSKATHSPPVSPEHSFPKPQITAVYKCRARQTASVAQLPPAISASALGLRRSARLRNKQRGFRVSFSRKQCPNSSVQGPPTANPTSPELPTNTTVEDFAQASMAGMAHAPLSIEQIQHCATHYCGLLAAQVTTNELLRDPTEATQIVPVTDTPAVANAEA
ncbi:hypothetical protein GUJ93_ZPchr0006g45237 [Zizania palustris]|uniref:Uncharacterized protein n=1 Tax=Zizania palustris TaxID=103762 RepID=A0A8J5S6D2_ZIZPA|nr:hypothetical protein GUJ93_ZPchr0006g45237 [Zizania palustris]